MHELLAMSAAALLAFVLGYASHIEVSTLQTLGDPHESEISAPAGGLFGTGTRAERATD
jgi:hypothetical protein